MGGSGVDMIAWDLLLLDEQEGPASTGLAVLGGFLRSRADICG